MVCILFILLHTFVCGINSTILAGFHTIRNDRLSNANLSFIIHIQTMNASGIAVNTPFQYDTFDLICNSILQKATITLSDLHAADIYSLTIQAMHDAYDIIEADKYESLLQIFKKSTPTSAASYVHDDVYAVESLKKSDSKDRIVCPIGRIAVITSSFCSYDSLKPALY